MSFLFLCHLLVWLSSFDFCTVKEYLIIQASISSSGSVPKFKEFIVDLCPTRLLSFMNIGVVVFAQLCTDALCFTFILAVMCLMSCSSFFLKLEEWAPSMPWWTLQSMSSCTSTMDYLRQDLAFRNICGGRNTWPPSSLYVHSFLYKYNSRLYNLITQMLHWCIWGILLNVNFVTFYSHRKHVLIRPSSYQKTPVMQSRTN